MARLLKIYYKKIIPMLMKKLKYTSVMAVPNIKKIVINVGVGEAINNKKILEFVCQDLMKISGQKPYITRAKKSVASFKIRKGYPIGCKVTLRGQKKWDFFDKLITIAIPRIRDFRGLSRNSFDGFGNYSLGIKEQIIFPEIEYDKIDCLRGMNITIVINSKTDSESYELLNAFNFPFRKNYN
ncbi:50S ribosomal protein L5 [Buchnera aphidicola]|uniref:Large ribosomal subunit protein uL5 n=1 Tax=Buchnera aphidicola subsp. Tuberolachnus salignus TaxID=98804 RepID=A0A170PC89_BUCTT|nr:50S ribosomal protein L5 [Buchnera aphidicola]CUR53309.1 50S ribosomal protein L5 [Buchnera aphidicola (Tuberolachnus salignus)]